MKIANSAVVLAVFLMVSASLLAGQTRPSKDETEEEYCWHLKCRVAARIAADKANGKAETYERLHADGVNASGCALTLVRIANRRSEADDPPGSAAAASQAFCDHRQTRLDRRLADLKAQGKTRSPEEEKADSNAARECVREAIRRGNMEGACPAASKPHSP